MAGYPSLQNMPAPCEGEVECEVSGLLVTSGPPGISCLVSSYPACHLASKQQEIRQAATHTDPASLFLPREGETPAVSCGIIRGVGGQIRRSIFHGISYIRTSDTLVRASRLKYKAG